MRLLALVLLAATSFAASNEEAASVLIQKVARATSAKTLTLQVPDALRPNVEQALRKSGLAISAEGLPVAITRTETATDCVLAAKVPMPDGFALFAESCLSADYGVTLASLHPVLRRSAAVLDLKKVPEGWLLLERTQVLLLPSLAPDTTPVWTKPVEPPAERAPRGRIVSTDPLDIRFGDFPDPLLEGCGGQRTALEVRVPEDGRISIAAAGSKPLILEGYPVALNPADGNSALLTILGPDQVSYYVWNVSVSCVR